MKGGLVRVVFTEAVISENNSIYGDYFVLVVSLFVVFFPSPVSTYLESVSEVVEGVSSNPRKDHEQVRTVWEGGEGK